MSATYETDFYAWANEQAALLRAGDVAAADLAHIAEEIESMGRTERRELVVSPSCSRLSSNGAFSPVTGAQAGIRRSVSSGFASGCIWATIPA